MIVKILKRTAAVAAILSTATVANANVLGMKKFHVGVDVKGNILNWSEKGGKNIFPKNPISLGAYVGADYYTSNEFGLGLELGVEYMQKTKKANIYEGQMINTGVELDGLNSISFKTKLREITPYLGLTGNYKINQNFKLTAMVGAGVSVSKAKQTLLQADDAGRINTAIRSDMNFKKNAFVPMARVGAQYDFNENVGVRVNVGYKYLNRVKAASKSPLGSEALYTMQAKKHSFNYGAGVVFSF